MTFVSWGLKQLLGTQKMITIQAFVLKKQENKESSLWEVGVGQPGRGKGGRMYGHPGGGVCRGVSTKSDHLFISYANVQ